MTLKFEDERPAAHKGDIDIEILKKIIANSFFNTTYGAWNAAGSTIIFTNGAHEGTYYPAQKTNFYFDVKVDDDPRIWHSLLKNPSDENSNVLANV